MDLGELRGFITVVTLLTFLAICWWAYRSDNRERFDQDALLPFLDPTGEGEVDAQEARGGSDEESR